MNQVIHPTNRLQDYDFRPRKGSSLIDAGKIIPGINDGQDLQFNWPPSFYGQNRRYVGDAPDIGAYEYGDSVYWIPGYRYPHPSFPIPRNNAVDVIPDYSIVWNYPYKKIMQGLRRPSALIVQVSMDRNLIIQIMYVSAIST